MTSFQDFAATEDFRGFEFGRGDDLINAKLTEAIVRSPYGLRKFVRDRFPDVYHHRRLWSRCDQIWAEYLHWKEKPEQTPREVIPQQRKEDVVNNTKASDAPKTSLASLLERVKTMESHFQAGAEMASGIKADLLSQMGQEEQPKPALSVVPSIIMPAEEAVKTSKRKKPLTPIQQLYEDNDYQSISHIQLTVNTLHWLQGFYRGKWKDLDRKVGTYRYHKAMHDLFEAKTKRSLEMTTSLPNKIDGIEVGRSNGTVGAIAFLLLIGGQEEKATTFFELICDQETDHPAIDLLLKKFISLSKEKDDEDSRYMPKRKVLTATVSAWNAWYNGEEIKKIITPAKSIPADIAGIDPWKIMIESFRSDRIG